MSSNFGVDFEHNLELRPRWEYVDIENNGRRTANAFTTRFRTGLNMKIQNVGFYGEITAVVPFYKNYSPEKEKYEIIPDKEELRITQLYGYLNYGLFSAKIGRQVINLDNQRFVGSVNWRQMLQTFDTIRIDVKPVKNLTLTAAYICSRQGVLDKFSTDVCSGETFNRSFVAHITFKPFNWLKVSAYAYYLKDNTDTYGLNFDGGYPINTILNIHYYVEYSHQINKTEKLRGTGNYFNIVLGSAYKNDYGAFFIKVNYERLGKRFITPLATLHKFNGWADIFLKYTAGGNTYGFKDVNLSVGYKHPLLGKIMGIYHFFSSTRNFPTGGKKFGKEMNLLWKRKLFKHTDLVIKYAYYNPDDDAKRAGIADKEVTKFWIMLSFKFKSLFSK